MNYPHQITTDSNAFTLWPDASEEELAVWAEAAGYSQQNNNFAFENLNATVAWGQSAEPPAATYEPQNVFETDWTIGGMGPVGDVLQVGIGASLADATVTDALAFAPAPPAPPFSGDGMDALTQDFSFDEYDFLNSLSSTPSLTNASSVPSPNSDSIGDGSIPYPMFEGGSFYSVQPSGPSSSSAQLDIAEELQPDLSTCPPPSWFMGEGNLAAPSLPDFLPPDLMNVIGNMPYPMHWNDTQANDQMMAPTEALTAITGEIVPSSSSLGKRRRNSEEDESGLQKKSRQNATRVPGGAESTRRARRSPVTRTLTRINAKSKEAGRGAGRLASTTVQGVYRQSLPGHSVSQGSMGTLVPRQPSWIEEREEEVQQDTGSAAPQQIVLQSTENAADGNLHPIPPKLSERQRLMLQTTQADEERRAVSAIKCRLCPLTRLSTWEAFKRHCKKCEKHPAEVKFCPRCGDYFARPDSKNRHYEDKNHKIYKEACRRTSPEEAREKKEEVELRLREFEASLLHRLRSGGEIKPFSHTMNKKLTNTSKKVSKQESSVVVVGRQLMGH